MATNVSTIGAGQDYATVALWEAATDNDLVTAGDIEEGHLVDNLTITATQTLSGATTDASNYRVLRPDAGNEYDPVAATGRTLTMTSDIATDGFVFSEGFFRFQDFLIISAVGAGPIYVTAGSDNSLVQRMFIRATEGSGAIWSDAAGELIIIWNCICDGTASTASFGIGITAGGSSDIYNCTVRDWEDTGIWLTDTGDNNIRNCASVDSTFNDMDDTGSGVGTKSHNLTSDATALGSSPQIDETTANTFTDADNEDYTLKTGSNAIDNGTDLSGDFTDDILGITRTGTWDIGAYQHPLGEPEQTLTSCTEGEWDDTVTFDACDDFWLTIDGPAGAVIKVSVTVELEEI